MDKSGEQSLAVCLGIGALAAVFLAGAIIGSLSAKSYETDRWQREAVKMDKAHWVTDEEGDVDWAWKP